MHTLILVAGENVESILLPYSEVEVDSHEAVIEGDDLSLMASHYGLPVTDTAALAPRIKEYFREDGFERDGRLFRITRENAQAHFDWYEIGGRWGAFLKLKEPRPTRRFLGLLPGPTLTQVTSARKKEIDQEHLLADPPACLVYDGQWHSSPIVLDGSPPPEWRRVFASLFAMIPEETQIHSVDIHGS